MSANPFYWGDTPYFDRVVIKGGGDAITAARSVLEADEADYAWNLQVDPDTLADMKAGGQGSVVSAFSGLVERIVINHTNPDPALGDNRSEYLDGTNPHPFLTFTPITQAMSMAIDRSTISGTTLRLRCQARLQHNNCPFEVCLDRERWLPDTGHRRRQQPSRRQRRARL